MRTEQIPAGSVSSALNRNNPTGQGVILENMIHGTTIFQVVPQWNALDSNQQWKMNISYFHSKPFQKPQPHVQLRFYVCKIFLFYFRLYHADW